MKKKTIRYDDETDILVLLPKTTEDVFRIQIHLRDDLIR